MGCGTGHCGSDTRGSSHLAHVHNAPLYIQAYAHVCMYICVYVCVYICVYICVYVCVYVCVCMCINSLRPAHHISWQTVHCHHHCTALVN